MVFAQEVELLVKENLAPIGPLVVEPLPINTVLMSILILMAVAAAVLFLLPRFVSKSLGLNSVLVLSSAALLGVLLPFTLYALSSSTTVLLKAAPGSVPKNTKVRNIKSHSFEIAWETDAETVGFVRYGTDPDNLEFFALDIKGSFPVSDHDVKAENLDSETIYYFEIVSGQLRFNDSNRPLQITTL